MRFLALLYFVCMGFVLAGGVFLLTANDLIQVVCGFAVILSVVFDLIGFWKFFAWRL